MSEKKENINDGKNIELDGVTVINEGIVLSEKEEKVEAPQEESATATTSEEEPQVEIPTEEPSIDTPVNLEPDVKIGADIPLINIDGIDADLGNTDVPEVTPTEEVAPTVDVVLPEVQNDTPLYNTTTEEQPTWLNPESNSQPTFEAEQPAQESYDTPSFEQIANNASNENSFEDAYANVELEKIKTTVASKEDVPKLRKSFLNVIEKAFDVGIVPPLNDLVEVVIAMDEKLAEVDNKGYVTGQDHEDIKALRRNLRGLKAKSEEEEFTPFQNASYETQPVTPVNNSTFNNDNIIQFPQSNFNDDQQNGFGGMNRVA